MMFEYANFKKETHVALDNLHSCLHVVVLYHSQRVLF